MIKLLLAVIAALFAAVGIALILRQDPGYMLVSMGDWTIETSVAFGVLFWLVTFLLLYWLVRLIIRLIQAPGQAKAAARRYRLRRAQRLLDNGMRQLIEGHWRKAEIYLMKGIEYSSTPVMYCIGAAQAARRLGSQARRPHGFYFRYADNRLAPDATLPIQLTEAQFALEEGQPAAARDTLQGILSRHPHQPRALELLALSYQALSDWNRLRELLPEVGKHALLNPTEYRQLQIQTYSAALKEAARHGSLVDLHEIWKKMPQELHEDDALLIDYAGHLRDLSAASEAEALLRKSLERHWSDKLVVGYGEIGRGNLTEQLASAEGWLKTRDNDPYLLLTCGRLAKRARQPDKARGYLERSIAALPTPDALQELGEILHESGDQEGALRCYQTALRLLSGKVEAKQGTALVPLAGAGQALPEQTRAVTLAKEAAAPAALTGRSEAPLPQAGPDDSAGQPAVSEALPLEAPAAASEQPALAKSPRSAAS